MKQLASVLLAATAAATLGWSQTPRGFGELFNQAPPHVDQALRARIATFYQLHQEKKFRQADKLVHEDSKDIFFEGDKNTFRAFKIVGITYEENYTRAKVVVDIDTDFFFPGFGQQQVNRPLSSTWKFADNEWWWYVAPFNGCKDSPFNCLKPNENGEAAPPPAGQSSAPEVIGNPEAMKDFKRVMEELRNKVTVDKTEAVFPSHEAAEAAITITNKWENPVHLSLDAPELLGLTLRIEKPLLPAGQSTRVVISSKPETRGAKPSIRAQLVVEEISKVIPIEIHFLPPPNTEPKPGTYIGPNAPPKR